MKKLVIWYIKREWKKLISKLHNNEITSKEYRIRRRYYEDIIMELEYEKHKFN